MKIAFLPLVFAITLCSLTFTANPQEQEQHHHHAGETLGTVSFPVSCAPAVQDSFNRSVALLYSFEYEAADQQFQQIAQRDPKCAMAYWGQAMSLYHQLWDYPSKDSLKRGAELLAKAREFNAPTSRERDYIQALSVFYTDTDQLDHSHRADAYCNAMKGVYERNPQDMEAAVFYALSLLGSGPDRDPNHINDKAAVAILSQLFDEQPTHPGIAHYIIHACDNPQMASLGLPAARKYAAIAPASAHAVHMPSHIFARLGLWQDDIKSNLAAIKVADSMGDMHLHVMHHIMHSMDFLEYAYLQIGDDAKAKAEVDAFAAIKKSDVEPDFVDFFEAHRLQAPAMYAIERRQWKEALNLQGRPDAPPYTQVVVYWARGVAAGHLHDAAAAQDALKHYDELVAATRKSAKPYIADGMKPEHDIVQAWAFYAEGKSEDALRLLRSVSDLQDKVGKGETELPAREMLADMLLDLKRPEEAFTEYEISLRTDPNRFNGLYGAAQAAEQLNQKEKAAAYYAQLLKNCETSDSDRPELVQAKTLVAAK
jgi:tetratricopeptide (TPR) repeat protein